MRMRAFILTGMAVLSAEPALAVEAGVTDARADDAIALFRSFCVTTKGDKSRAEAVLGDGNALSKKLSSAMMERLQGTTGGVGWAIGSPRGAQLLLGYSPKIACEVRIGEADEASVITAYNAMVASLDAAGNGHQSAPEKRTQGASEVTFRQFDWAIDGRRALIALSTASQKVGEQQHLITFGFVS